ncbi:hypothetical protein [Thalassotalea hakodatensis]|uniref:hypothetical protein n=1 Tax=Thalassotalea hakodatensis TaxID=3030492 RepID=UPI002573F6DE|nr:hypothetical protein [Thalassotalea hakodatensis]
MSKLTTQCYLLDNAGYMERNIMRELNVNEIEKVDGGVRGLGWGAVGAYLYESVGGAKGINDHLRKSWASASASARYYYRKLF